MAKKSFASATLDDIDDLSLSDIIGPAELNEPENIPATKSKFLKKKPATTEHVPSPPQPLPTFTKERPTDKLNKQLSGEFGSKTPQKPISTRTRESPLRYSSIEDEAQIISEDSTPIRYKSNKNDMNYSDEDTITDSLPKERIKQETTPVTSNTEKLPVSPKRSSLKKPMTANGMSPDGTPRNQTTKKRVSIQDTKDYPDSRKLSPISDTSLTESIAEDVSEHLDPEEPMLIRQNISDSEEESSDIQNEQQNSDTVEDDSQQSDASRMCIQIN